jgi:hypothetical protein
MPNVKAPTPEEIYGNDPTLTHIQRAEKIKQSKARVELQKAMILRWVKNCEYLKE